VTAGTEFQRKATNCKDYVVLFGEFSNLGVSSVLALKEELLWTHVSFPYLILNRVLPLTLVVFHELSASVTLFQSMHFVSKYFKSFGT